MTRSTPLAIHTTGSQLESHIPAKPLVFASVRRAPRELLHHNDRLKTLQIRQHGEKHARDQGEREHEFVAEDDAAAPAPDPVAAEHAERAEGVVLQVHVDLDALQQVRVRLADGLPGAVQAAGSPGEDEAECAGGAQALQELVLDGLRGPEDGEVGARVGDESGERFLLCAGDYVGFVAWGDVFVDEVADLAGEGAEGDAAA